MSNAKKTLTFLTNEDGQGFAEYALILGAIAVIVRHRTESCAAFNQGIGALRQAQRG